MAQPVRQAEEEEQGRRRRQLRDGVRDARSAGPPSADPHRHASEARRGTRSHLDHEQGGSGGSRAQRGVPAAVGARAVRGVDLGEDHEQRGGRARRRSGGEVEEAMGEVVDREEEGEYGQVAVRL